MGDITTWSQWGNTIVSNREEYMKTHPGSAVFARYAEELIEENKIDKAIDVLRWGIESHPNYAPGYSVLATAYFAKGRDDEAVVELEKALRLDNQMPVDLLRLGRHYLNRQVAVKALTPLWLARRFEPDTADVSDLYEEASALLKTQRDLNLSEQSERALSELIEEAAADETLIAGPEKVVSLDALTVAKTGNALPVETAVEEEMTPQAEAPDIDINSLAIDSGDDIIGNFLNETSSDTMIGIPASPDQSSENPSDESEISEIDRYLSLFEAGEDAESVKRTRPAIVPRGGKGVTVVEEQVDVLDIEAPDVVGDDEFDALLDEGASAVDIADEIETADVAEESFEGDRAGGMEIFGDQVADIGEPSVVSDEEFEALLDEGAPDVDIADTTGGAMAEGSFEEDLTEGIETFDNRTVGSEELAEVGDDEFDALLNEGAPAMEIDEEAGEEKVDDVFGDTRSDETGSIEEPSVAVEEPSVVDDDAFEALVAENAPDIDVDMLTVAGLGIEEEAESAVPAESDESGSIDETETLSFEEEVAGLGHQDLSHRLTEPVGSGSGDVPEIIDVHEINEDETYDPGTFSSVLPDSDNSEPLLSDEERAELLALEFLEASPENDKIPQDGALDAGLPDEFISIVGAEHIIYDELAEPDDNVSETGGMFIGELSTDELDELSETREEKGETVDSLEAERREGIDYSDILSELMEPRSIEDSLDEAGGGFESVSSRDFLSETISDAETVDEFAIDEAEFDRLAFGDNSVSGEEAEGTVSPNLMETGESVYEDITAEKNAGAISYDELSPAYGLSSRPETDESAQFVEDLIKNAPDVGFDENGEIVGTIDEETITGATMAVGETVSEFITMDDDNAENLSLDDLISQYESTIERKIPQVSPASKLAGKTEMPEDEFRLETESYFEDTIDGDTASDHEDSGEVTATMAEIYVSQGFAGQAIKIYEAILKKQPDNARARARLEELRNSDEEGSAG